jgi:hypothetical protein
LITLAVGLFLSNQGHELLVPKLDSLRLRKQSHPEDHGRLPSRDFTHLPRKSYDFRHLLPRFRDARRKGAG